MLLLTTRGGARYRKLPEGTITPLRQAQQADRVKYDKIWGTRSNPSLTARIRRYGYTLGGR